MCSVTYSFAHYFVVLLLIEIVQAQNFLQPVQKHPMASVEGYWKKEGDWLDGLNEVIDDISRGCGFGRSQYVLMNSEDAQGLGQADQVGECLSSSLSVPWSGSEIWQFNPNAPETIVNILSSVSLHWQCLL